MSKQEASVPTTSPPVADGQPLLWRFAAFELNEASGELQRDGKRIAVEPKPVQMLMLLLRRVGEVCTKNELLDALWPGRVVTESALARCAAKLRVALNDEAQALLRTVHGFGYRLVTVVQVEAAIAAETRCRQAGEPVPRRSGWVLQRRLGEGGHGEVWLAQHKTGEQRVFKFADTPGALASLKREITVSRLLHTALGELPCLQPVLDWNLDDNPCYLETPYRPLGSLAELLASPPDSLPTLETRVHWLAEVAETLAEAHALGLLHKDLKPSNLLRVETADGRDRLLIADWGSGHLLDPASLAAAHITRLGFTREAGSAAGGTPLYQAPEVLSGQPATVAADLYSLGVILYQLVIGDGRRPLAAGWEQDIDDPLLREDIAAAAAGQVSRRLGSARELAERLRNRSSRLEERALVASREKAMVARERELERQGLRRRWQGVAAAVFLAGFATSAWLWNEARLARDRAEASAEKAQQEAATAHAITRFLTDDLLSRANPHLTRDSDVRVRDLLDAATERLQRHLADQPATRITLKRVLGAAYTGLNDRARAEPLLQKALAEAIALHGSGAAETQDLRLALLDLYDQVHDVDAEEALAREVLLIEQAAGRQRSAPALRARSTLAGAAALRSGFDQAGVAGLLTVAEDSRAALGERHPQALVADMLACTALLAANRIDESLRRWQSLIPRLQAAYGEDAVFHIVHAGSYASVLRRSGRNDEALAFARPALDRLTAVYGPTHPETLLVLFDLARVELELGQAASALQHFQNLVDSRREQGPDDYEGRIYRGFHALALDGVGRHSEALQALEAVVADNQRIDGPGHPNTLRELDRLAAMLGRQGAVARQGAVLRRAEAAARAHLPETQWQRALAIFRLGIWEQRQKPGSAAATRIHEGYRLLRGALGPGHANVVEAEREMKALGIGPPIRSP